MGAEGFHGRVRDGIGCLAPRYGHQAGPRTTARRGGRSGGHVRRRKKCLDEAASGSCRCTRAASGGTRFRRGAFGEAPGSSANRAISTGQLERVAPLSPPAYRRGGLPRLSARPGFEGGFPLRCVQRLSRPHLATRRCGWRHNRYTRGASLPVLSYWGERLASLEHPRQIGTELSHDVLNPAHVPL